SGEVSLTDPVTIVVKVMDYRAKTSHSYLTLFKVVHLHGERILLKVCRVTKSTSYTYTHTHRHTHTHTHSQTHTHLQTHTHTHTRKHSPTVYPYMFLFASLNS